MFFIRYTPSLPDNQRLIAIAYNDQLKDDPTFRRDDIMTIAPKKIRQCFLLLSALTIFLVASIYGMAPDWFASQVLHVALPNHDVAHLLRALMCLYFGFACFWLYAAFNIQYRNPALLTVFLFPAGLVVGRIMSFAVDGKPSPLLLFYLVMELVQVPLAWWVFRLKE